MEYIDILISVMQGTLSIYMINYCMDKVKMDNKKLIIYIVLFSAIIINIPKISESILLSSFLTHFCTLILITYMFFRQKDRNIFIIYSLMYSIVIMWIYIFGNLLYGVLGNIFPDIHMKISTAIIMYGSQVILFVLCYTFKLKIKQIYKILIFENIPFKYVILFSFIPDFLNSFNFVLYKIDNPMYIYIIYVAIFIFLVFSIISFVKIVKKSNYIKMLNKTLTKKNDELKKIKNSYGLQMACLYELCDMEKYDDATNLLKSIINQRGMNVNDENVSNSSLLSIATKHVMSDGIDVIIEDNANLRLTTINEMELYRIIVNIVNNAKRAMRNKGTLIAKSFEELKNIIITIENDGEKIPEEVIDKIFDLGFTTKKDNDKNHGYGLSIAKELIENHNGGIVVESSEAITKFTISLPKKYI